MTQPMLFDEWTGLVRVLVVGALAYGGLVAMLRVSGKRTLSKMNAFDMVVTVAIGSTLATVLLSDTVPLAEGLTGLALLIGLQYALTWASVRSDRLQNLVKSEPRLLLRDGAFLRAAMRDERVTQEEIEAAIRQQGAARPSEVAFVVLETDGSLSVATGAASAEPLAPRTGAG